MNPVEIDTELLGLLVEREQVNNALAALRAKRNRRTGRLSDYHQRELSALLGKESLIDFRIKALEHERERVGWSRYYASRSGRVHRTRSCPRVQDGLAILRPDLSGLVEVEMFEAAGPRNCCAYCFPEVKDL